MKVMRLADPGNSALLVEGEESQPVPGPGELLVRVLAAGITPTELAWYPTTHDRAGGARNGAVPSHEFSGVVASMGEGAGAFTAGQEVYGMNDWFEEGALAEYCLAQPASVALKPARLTHAEAASVPIGALTAWQGLFQRADLQPGEHVLVHGGAGSVGVYAVQLARRHGAHVTATVSQRNLEFVSSLGAEQVIDYHAERFEDRVQKVDVVFDTVGAETLQRSWDVLKPGGRMVTIAAEGEGAREERVQQAFFIVTPDQRQLTEVGELLASGALQPVVDAVLPLEQAAAAYAGRISARQGRGKVVVAIAPGA